MSGPADRPDSHDPDHDHDDEVDPTGIRDLLAGLPDPGPMPDDLVRRIEARLEVEQTVREQESSRPLGRHADRVVDLATERGRRRPARTLGWLGAAAAGLFVTAAVVPQLVDGLNGTDSADTAAYYPSSRGDAADDAMSDDGGDAGAAGGGTDAAEGEAAPGATGDAGGAFDTPGTLTDADEAGTAGESGSDEAAKDESTPELALVPPDGELVLLGDLGRVEAERLTQALVLAVDEHDASGTPPARMSGVLTEGQAASCWRGLADTHAFDRYAAAPARAVLPDGQRQGEPVVVLLGLHDDGSARSWIMPHGCTGRPDLAPIAEGDPRD